MREYIVCVRGQSIGSGRQLHGVTLTAECSQLTLCVQQAGSVSPTRQYLRVTL